MNDFKFSTIEYIRPDFDQYESELVRMAEALDNATSYEEAKQIFKDNEALDNKLSTMCTVAHIRNTLVSSVLRI